MYEQRLRSGDRVRIRGTNFVGRVREVRGYQHIAVAFAPTRSNPDGCEKRIFTHGGLILLGSYNGREPV